jgi:hypothetical protein
MPPARPPTTSVTGTRVPRITRLAVADLRVDDDAVAGHANSLPAGGLPGELSRLEAVSLRVIQG